MGAGQATMGRKKKASDANIPKSRDPSTWNMKPLAVQVRGSAEWKAWVERLAARDRASVADLTDRALAAYARQIGFAEEPPER
jgi:hypothetical protein